MAITGDTGYDWFSQWGANDALAENYAANLLTWNNYFTWIKSTNDIISTIDPEALTTATKHILGFAYAYRASFYLDLVRLYEFKENKYTSADGVLGLAVPIVTETTTEAEAKANPRASAADVYESDLPRPRKGGDIPFRLLGDRSLHAQFGYGLWAPGTCLSGTRYCRQQSR